VPDPLPSESIAESQVRTSSTLKDDADHCTAVKQLPSRAHNHNQPSPARETPVSKTPSVFRPAFPFGTSRENPSQATSNP